jgi:hypothetical protein
MVSGENEPSKSETYEGTHDGLEEFNTICGYINFWTTQMMICWLMRTSTLTNL